MCPNPGRVSGNVGACSALSGCERDSCDICEAVRRKPPAPAVWRNAIRIGHRWKAGALWNGGELTDVKHGVLRAGANS
jgi:hypothetical protein